MLFVLEDLAKYCIKKNSPVFLKLILDHIDLTEMSLLDLDEEFDKMIKKKVDIKVNWTIKKSMVQW
jgi:hypothetical protein